MRYDPASVTGDIAMRPPLGNKAMNAVERRQKSDADKKKSGEARITTWVTKDAAKALNKLKKAGGSTREIVSNSLIEAAEREA
jgi:hypothetical protein